MFICSVHVENRLKFPLGRMNYCRDGNSKFAAFQDLSLLWRPIVKREWTSMAWYGVVTKGVDADASSSRLSKSVTKELRARWSDLSGQNIN